MLDPLQELAGEILLAGLVLLDQLLVPGEIAIDPGLDRVLVPSSSRHREPAGPAVVGQQGHGDLVPLGRAGGTVAEDGHDHIMPVAKDVGSHHQLLPHRPLDGESPAVNLRRDSGNDHSRRSPVTHPVPLRLSCRCHDSLSPAVTIADRGQTSCHRQPPVHCRQGHDPGAPGSSDARRSRSCPDPS